MKIALYPLSHNCAMDNNDLLCISGKMWHSHATAGKFSMLRRSVWYATIVMLYGSLTMMHGMHFFLFIKCIFITRKWRAYPESAISCSFIKIMSMAKVYLDVIIWSTILLLCRHASLLALLSLLSRAKLSFDPLILFSAVAAFWCPSFFVRHLSLL